VFFACDCACVSCVCQGSEAQPTGCFGFWALLGFGFLSERAFGKLVGLI